MNLELNRNRMAEATFAAICDDIGTVIMGDDLLTIGDDHDSCYEWLEENGLGAYCTMDELCDYADEFGRRCVDEYYCNFAD